VPLLLVMGPSGVGKTAVIRFLERLDSRFAYVCPWTTRRLRPGETDKISVTPEQLAQGEADGQFLVVNELFGAKYATPRAPITEALLAGGFPVIDWPISRVGIMEAEFPNALFRSYLCPPSLEVLKERLRDRDPTGQRFAEAEAEWNELLRGTYVHHWEYCATNHEGKVAEVAQALYDNFISRIPEVTRGRRT
jgi:guanylate kinase